MYQLLRKYIYICKRTFDTAPSVQGKKGYENIKKKIIPLISYENFTRSMNELKEDHFDSYFSSSQYMES